MGCDWLATVIKKRETTLGRWNWRDDGDGRWAGPPRGIERLKNMEHEAAFTPDTEVLSPRLFISIVPTLWSD